MVHAPFKKVVKFDLICMAIGVVVGMGIGHTWWQEYDSLTSFFI